MLYLSVNQLQDFEFHDSFFTLNSLENKTLSVFAKHLNIHKNTEQNSAENDMEIDVATITFSDFSVKSFEPCRAYKIDEQGNSYTEDPLVIFYNKEAHQKFMEELKSGFSVNCFDATEKGMETVVEFSGGKTSFFNVIFSFSSVAVEWDKYRRKAWYELHHSYEKKLHLDTPSGEVIINAYFHLNEEVDDLEESPEFSIGIKYNDQWFYSQGNNYLWIDAFANLQKQLPENVFLKCCLACRHGNQCPVGNSPDEVFCTKDISITQKSDLFFYTEDEKEREKRSRTYTDVCNDHQPQRADYFTYNDYPYLLK